MCDIQSAIFSYPPLCDIQRGERHLNSRLCDRPRRVCDIQSARQLSWQVAGLKARGGLQHMARDVPKLKFVFFDIFWWFNFGTLSKIRHPKLNHQKNKYFLVLIWELKICTKNRKTIGKRSVFFVFEHRLHFSQRPEIKFFIIFYVNLDFCKGGVLQFYQIKSKNGGC